MSEQELKTALVKELPDKVVARGRYAYNQKTGEHDFLYNHFHWGSRVGREVIDTEWLHVCWLAEQALSIGEYESFANKLGEIVKAEPFFKVETMRSVVSATWQQRAEALIRVKANQSHARPI